MKKCCAFCNKRKPVDDFVKDKRRPTGISNKCKQCKNEARRVDYAANPQKYLEYNKRNYRRRKQQILAQGKIYYQRNKQKINERNKAYLKAHPEIKKKISKKYYTKNKDKINKASIAWQKKNPDRVKANHKKHRQKNSDVLKERSRMYREKNPDYFKAKSKERWQNNYDEMMKKHVEYERIRRKRIGNSYLKKLLRAQNVPIELMQDEEYLNFRRALLKVKRAIKNKTKKHGKN